MADLQQGRPPVNVAQEYPDRPAIHVGLADGLDADYFKWVAIGAEEEGIPCRQVAGTGSDVAALAYAAALGSRLGVGVGISQNLVAVHEFHMPASQPVLIYEISESSRIVCRLAGSNAARLVVGLPLSLDQ